MKIDYINTMTHKIIRRAMEVHDQIWYGIQKVVNQRALSIELSMNEIQNKRELEMPLEYKKVHNNTVLDRANGLNHDSKGLRDDHDFKTSKKSSNHDNPKNQGSDNGT